MTDGPNPSFEQLERELQYYRREYNEIGARLLRAQEEQSRVAREARRSRTVARLVRESYQIIDHDIPAETIGPLMLATIADTAVCDCAALLLVDPAAPERFLVQHAFGTTTPTLLTLPDPPDHLYTAGRTPPVAAAAPMIDLLGVPFILWAYDPATGRALLLGNRTESNIHRAFEAGDRELVEVSLAVYNDLLVRKRAEIALREAKQAAEDANAVRARFLATLSHEFRSPLEAVIGFSELLLQTGRQTPGPEQKDEFARQILDSGHRLLALVKDILDFSRFNNTVPYLRRDWLSLGVLLRNAVRSFAAEAASREIRIDVAVPEMPIEVSIDYERFRQILANLIGNALKFTPAGGVITVGGIASAGDGASITVSDTGIGIAPQDLPRTLEPFVQVYDPAGPRVSGAGLGLPIAKQLVEAHNATLTIRSAPGAGTSVIITLPASYVRCGGRQSEPAGG
ncbi:sensor histidine kinase [Acidiphilium acidophilum]|uniref:histidine kinase n=1 Tax=Acidiphilium acidophilum TaxID=76588 RepID=A0AAW9DSF0_ACIAO|nr:HAMP domain-containing sensor histidine kinase [Acidiphilium acidophilum]MDX5931945.1 HAMP domain-containing sensor histidine kinase [Acidiphilium acidophilum]